MCITSTMFRKERSFEQIVKFLDVLQDESAYIVEVRDLELDRRRSEDNIWTLELEISGYYIPEEVKIATGVIYSDFVPYTRHPEILSVFNYKARLLSEDSNKQVEEEESEDQGDRNDNN